MEAKSQLPEGIPAALGLVTMIILLMVVGLDSRATGPLAALSAGLFVMAFLIHLTRSWKHPEKGSLVEQLRQYRYVLLLFAVIAVVVAALKAETLLLGLAGATAIFFVLSIFFLIAASWVTHVQEIYSLVSQKRGRFRDNPRGWLSPDVAFVFLPILIFAGMIISAFMF